MTTRTTPLIGLLVLMFSGSFYAQQFRLITTVDSDYRETNLSITPNGKYLFFMSQRGGQAWSELRLIKEGEDKAQHDGDIWFCVKEEGKWQSPQCLGEHVNTYDGEDEPNITADGQAVYYQSWGDNWRSNGGPYYRATLDGVVWKNAEGLGNEINRFFQEIDTRGERVLKKDLKAKNLYDKYLELIRTHRESWDEELQKIGINMDDYKTGTDGMAVSPNEKIFIVSAFTPEKKKYDLYISYKNGDGAWTYPRLLNIQNDSDEISVYIAGDNKTIYFASNRKDKGYGGYDVYKTTLTGKYDASSPVNLGKNINTEKDEYGFVPSSLDSLAYMVREGSIYEVDFKVPPLDIQYINGVVIDKEGEPVASSVELVDATGNIIGTAISNKNTGEYAFSYERIEGEFNQRAISVDGLKAESPYTVETGTPKVLDFIIVIDRAANDRARIIDELNEGDLVEGEVLRVDKLYFEANQADIQSSSIVMLRELSAILKRRPEIEMIEIGGHTNGLPAHDFCDDLSLRRAKEVHAFMKKQGVPIDRMAYKGYGKRKPIATNDTLAGRKLNQRVEIKIIRVKK